MLYKFDDINDKGIYIGCRVMFVTGQYNIFNNIVIDELKNCSIGSSSNAMDIDILNEFGIDTSNIKVSNNIDLNTFMTAVQTPSINGKWFCSVNLASLTKKQNDWLKEYIKNPNENGILVLDSISYKDYRFWLNNKKIPTDPCVSLIQLSFPRRDALKLLVSNLFLKNNARIEERALDLFIVRMSSAYDQYNQVIEKICVDNLPEGYLQMDVLDVPVLTYDKVFDALRGIENFVLDDFIEQLVVPLKSEKPRANNIIFRMLGYLIEEYGSRKLVNILLSRVKELIEFRMCINIGYIPIIVNYNVDECKKLIGETSEISKKSDYQFKRLAKLASKTSLNDWTYMQMILQTPNVRNDESYIIALFHLVFRSVLTESRLSNAIHMENLVDHEIEHIDKLRYFNNPNSTETTIELLKPKEEK